MSVSTPLPSRYEVARKRARLKAQARARAGDYKFEQPVAPESEGEWQNCSFDAARFINQHVQIDEPQDKEYAVIPFKLWPDRVHNGEHVISQVTALGKMVNERLLIILKARQLGLTWLCCAYALWVCLFRPGQVVLLFSQGKLEALELARRIKSMYERLPEWMREMRPLISQNLSQLKWSNGSTVRSLAATRKAGRSFTASLALMDEAAFMQYGAELYSALKPTIDGGGQLFILSTANGETGFFHDLWKKAIAGLNNFATLFLSWRARPGRTDAWRAQVASEALSSVLDLQEYPATAEEAFQASGNERFLPSMIWWDACRDGSNDNPRIVPPLSRHIPLVLAADAGVTSDSFGLVGIGRHPDYDDLLVVYLVHEWKPKPGAPLDFDEIEDEIRGICSRLNVLYITYDPYQLHQMMTRLRQDKVVHTRPFQQGAERLTSDKHALDIITQLRVIYDSELPNIDKLREHLNNADRKLDTEENKLRIVKRSEDKKIDLAVAFSMAAYRASRKRPGGKRPTSSSSTSSW